MRDCGWFHPSTKPAPAVSLSPSHWWSLESPSPVAHQGVSPWPLPGMNRVREVASTCRYSVEVGGLVDSTCGRALRDCFAVLHQGEGEDLSVGFEAVVGQLGPDHFRFGSRIVT